MKYSSIENHHMIISRFLEAYVMPQTYSKDFDKFATRSSRYIFVGYPYGKKASKLYDLDTKEYFELRFCFS